MSAAVNKETLAYSLKEMAEQTGVGITRLRTEILEGKLTAKCFGTKLVILADEARRYLKALPESAPNK